MSGDDKECVGKVLDALITYLYDPTYAELDHLLDVLISAQVALDTMNTGNYCNVYVSKGTYAYVEEVTPEIATLVDKVKDLYYSSIKRHV